MWHLIEAALAFDTEWANRRELWFDCGFQSYADRIDGKRGETPVVTIFVRKR